MAAIIDQAMVHFPTVLHRANHPVGSIFFNAAEAVAVLGPVSFASSETVASAGLR